MTKLESTVPQIHGSFRKASPPFWEIQKPVTTGINLKDRGRYKSSVVLVDHDRKQDYRVKVWIQEENTSQVLQRHISINGETVVFQNNRNGLYVGEVTATKVRSIKSSFDSARYDDIKSSRDHTESSSDSGTITTKKTEEQRREEKKRKLEEAWEWARRKRVSEREEAFSKVFGENGVSPDESPATNARKWCHHILDKGDGRTKTFWWFRGAINHIDYWRNHTKEPLERRVQKQVEDAERWISRWTRFANWWSDIPIRKDVYNDRFIRRLHEIFNRDIQSVIDELEKTKSLGYRGEIVEAAEEADLQVWEGSENWDDGYIWFRYPDTGVLFPFSLLWIHKPSQNHPWRINSEFKVNEWALGRYPLPDITQDMAWHWCNFYLVGQAKVVGPDFKLTNRLLPYVGGYQNRPNHLFAPCIEQVRRYAATNQPPEPIPLVNP